MTALSIAVSLVKQFEGCRLTAYRCPAGIWTIGYGETKGVKQGDVWTQARADGEVQERVEEFMQGVLKVCPRLSGNQLAACTSLAYNIGLRAFSTSTVARKVNEGKVEDAANAFLLWNKAGGQVLKGLVTKRNAERETFLKGLK